MKPRPARPPAAIYACGHVYACVAGSTHPPGRHAERCPTCVWRDGERMKGKRPVAPQGAAEAAKAALGERA